MKKETLLAPLAGGVLMLLAGLAGLVVGKPWLFPSLGPTAWLQVEDPDLPAARPWNTVVGHLCGLLCGYLSVFLAGASDLPSVLVAHILSPERVAASVLALTLTLAAASLLKASHPPAGATTLLVSLGAFRPEDAFSVIAGVAIVAAAGEAVRRWMLKVKSRPGER
jgi:CBS-domain-containing membrane protein